MATVMGATGIAWLQRRRECFHLSTLFLYQHGNFSDNNDQKPRDFTEIIPEEEATETQHNL